MDESLPPQSPFHRHEHHGPCWGARRERAGRDYWGSLGICRHRPFAWQQGQTLWILDWEESAWVLAELRFDGGTCSYQECRRSRYRWQREAAGALLGRVLAAGDEAAGEAAKHLTSWLAPDSPRPA
jgi:hypothetical protein